MLDGRGGQDFRVGRVAPEGELLAPFVPLAALLQHHFQIDGGKIVRFEWLPNLFKAPLHALIGNDGVKGVFLLFPLFPGAQHAVPAEGQHDLVRLCQGGQNHQRQ